MAKVVGYHRPDSLDQALALLASTDSRRIVLAGGTVVNTDRSSDPIEVVDLQALNLHGISLAADGLDIGAMATLDALATGEHVPSTLAMLARRELPSTLRTIGTIGGLIVTANPESELLAGLLAHGATLTLADVEGPEKRDLADILASGPGDAIVTKVHVETGGVTAAVRTGRTPGDRPIVAAVARRAEDGTTRLAMCGVADIPVLVDDVAGLSPRGDFRGSSQYRHHLARVLAGRVLEELS